MAFSIEPTTAPPGSSIQASGTGKRKTATRIRIDGLVAVSFTMPAKGHFTRTFSVPIGADRVVPVVLQQLRSDGVWAQTASASLTIKSVVVEPPSTAPRNLVATAGDRSVTLTWQA